MIQIVIDSELLLSIITTFSSWKYLPSDQPTERDFCELFCFICAYGNDSQKLYLYNLSLFVEIVVSYITQRNLVYLCF